MAVLAHPDDDAAVRTDHGREVSRIQTDRLTGPEPSASEAGYTINNRSEQLRRKHAGVRAHAPRTTLVDAGEARMNPAWRALSDVLIIASRAYNPSARLESF
jgi:hypothetical protein